MKILKKSYHLINPVSDWHKPETQNAPMCEKHPFLVRFFQSILFHIRSSLNIFIIASITIDTENGSIPISYRNANPMNTTLKYQKPLQCFQRLQWFQWFRQPLPCFQRFQRLQWFRLKKCKIKKFIIRVTFIILTGFIMSYMTLKNHINITRINQFSSIRRYLS